MKFSLIGALMLATAGHSCAQFIYTTIDDPKATGGTIVQGISGNNIVGYYTDSTGLDNQSFLYNGSSYITLNDPNAQENVPGQPNGTYATGISGSNIVGYYYNSSGVHSFLYNGSTYTTLASLGSGTVAEGVSGNNIVGYYFVGSGSYGFLYNGSTYTTIENSNYTYLTGISGDTILGQNGPYPPTSFTYNNGIFTALTSPVPPPDYITANGISGHDIVGQITGSTGFEGFLYDGTSYTYLNDPNGLNSTYATGISGGDIVGTYYDSNGNTNGFLAVAVPEPSNLGLILFGIAGLTVAHRFVLKRR
jgi:hypothetical protein